MRSRNIKPTFFKNDLLAEISPEGRLLFIGLWCLADREGRLEDRPKRIKGELFPFDSFDVEKLLQGLCYLGFIIRYESQGNRYIWIPNFEKHQSPHYSEKNSIIPPYLPEIVTDHDINTPGVDGSSSQTDSRKTPGKSSDDEENFPEDSRNTPGVDGSLRGGRNPLNPESRILNPDSLNPDSTKKLSSPKNASAPFHLPEDIPEQPFHEWLKIRKAKRATNSPYAMKLLVRKLRGISKNTGIPIEDLIQTAILRNWTGIEEDWILKTAGGHHVGPTGHRSKTYREIDTENEERNRREYLISSGLLQPERPCVDADLPGLSDAREKNAHGR